MQKPGESAIDYIRRALAWLSHEDEAILSKLKTTRAVTDYFELWHKYDTDLLDGILEAISEGADPAPAMDFNKKNKMGWGRDIRNSVNYHRQLQKQENAARRKNKLLVAK